MKVVYALHSGQLFGTERMALATLQTLGPRIDPVLLAPPGPLHAEARQRGISSFTIRRSTDLVHALARHLMRDRGTAVMSTGVGQALAIETLRLATGWRGRHLHMVHGGTDERLSYGRKRLLNPMAVQFVAVSDFVRDRLVAHGVPLARIEVIHNFLHGPPAAQRQPYLVDGVRKVVMLSRLDRIKRVGLLFDALDRNPELRVMSFDLYGTGELQEELAVRAREHPNVVLKGFQSSAAAALSEADLLLHTCPEEPFGLVILEAFAAGVAVLAPNAGGAADIVDAPHCGFGFTANSPAALAQALARLQHTSANRLREVAERGRDALERRFSARRQVQRYAELLDLPSPPEDSRCDSIDEHAWHSGATRQSTP